MDVVPTVLVVTGNWWALGSRVALAFARNGWKVVAACPLNSPLCYVKRVRSVLPLRTLAPRRSLVQAIRTAQPDLIVPCDDSSVFLLHQIHAEYAELRRIIEDSLGQPGAFGLIESREQLQQLAANAGIRVPRSVALESAARAAERFADFPQGAVVKLDGTNGGEGVTVVRSKAEAAAAFRRARIATSAVVAAKRALVNRDTYAFWTWRRREHSRISMQEYISGTPANIMAACWQGQVLATVSVEALSCQGLTGAANLVRRIERPEFREAAEALAARLKLSGFFGLDFMIDRESDLAYLIEMNPRCTQLGHLQFPDQGDLVSALCERAAGHPAAPVAQPIREPVIAFFPQAWRWKSDADEWKSAFHDIPWGEDALINNLLSEPWPDRRPAARLYHWVRPPQRPEGAIFQAKARNLIRERLAHGLERGESVLPP
ncbi:MAG: ATP-grasp domain-containing protein [Steroidobacteraceae bacterium]